MLFIAILFLNNITNEKGQNLFSFIIFKTAKQHFKSTYKNNKLYY